MHRLSTILVFSAALTFGQYGFSSASAPGLAQPKTELNPPIDAMDLPPDFEGLGTDVKRDIQIGPGIEAEPVTTGGDSAIPPPTGPLGLAIPLAEPAFWVLAAVAALGLAAKPMKSLKGPRRRRRPKRRL